MREFRFISTDDSYLHLSRAIGETMERLDVLIALRKASESHIIGKKKTGKEDVG